MPRVNRIVLVIASCLCPTVLGGNLSPAAGPVAPTMKTLQQVEPRVPLDTVPGNAEAMHVITQPGSYYLTQCESLTPGKQTWVRVGASDVSIDMMGFDVDGALDPAGVGVRPTGEATYNNLVVRNGGFSRWYQGINATDGGYFQGGLLDSLRFDNMLLTGALAPDFAVVSNCSAQNCGADGLVMYNGGTFKDCSSRGSGTGFNCGHGATLQNCQAQDCGTGFYCFYDNSLSNCAAVYCGTGFYGNGGHTLLTCNAQKCGYGFVFFDRCLLNSCSAAFSANDGLQLSAQNSVTNCNFSENSTVGVHLFGSGNTVTGCNASYNGGLGLRTESASGNNTIRENTVTECFASGGIEINGSQSRIEANHVTGCAATGIVVYGAANLVIRNSACGNGIGPGDSYFIDSSNAAGPILNPSDMVTSSNPHANYQCGVVPVNAARAGAGARKSASDPTPPGPRVGPGVGAQLRHLTVESVNAAR